MTTLIAGRFTQQDQAENASVQLMRSGFSAQDMSLFFVNPQGQHDLHPIGGDEDESAGTHHASTGAVAGAAGGVGVGALVGAATLPVLGPGGPLLGAAIGAYTGSLVGALNTMKKQEEQEELTGEAPARSEDEAGIAASEDTHPRKAGVVLAVAVATPEQRASAIEILGATAQEIEEAEGELRNGQWVDFDPREPIKPVE